MTNTVMNTEQVDVIKRMKNTFPKQGDVFMFTSDSGKVKTVVVVRLSPSVWTFIDIPSWNRFTSYSFEDSKNLYTALEGTDIVDFRLIEQINVTLD